MELIVCGVLKIVKELKMLKILDFYAQWCGQCRKMMPMIDEVIELYNDRIHFEKINAEENKHTAEKYGVYSLPCIIFLRDNNEILKITGMITKSKLIDTIEELIK